MKKLKNGPKSGREKGKMPVKKLKNRPKMAFTGLLIFKKKHCYRSQCHKFSILFLPTFSNPHITFRKDPYPYYALTSIIKRFPYLFRSRTLHFAVYFMYPYLVFKFYPHSVLLGCGCLKHTYFVPIVRNLV